MQVYGVREVQKLLHLPLSTIRTLVHAGFVAPARGPRNAWRFSFQDLIVLRTAQALADAKIPARRIARSMKELRRHLPSSMPLSGLKIAAEADRVVVREGTGRWQADSGQYVLEFGGSPADGTLTMLQHPSPAPEPFKDAGDFIARGRALHEARQLDEAERIYRRGIETCGDDAVLLFNLGVLLEDLGRKPDAVMAYQRALSTDAQFADGHYNLALLYEELGKGKDAIRHMAQYRRLMKRT